MSDKIVKNLNFGQEAKDKVFNGIEKLTKAVSSTLGASGKCVILENGVGNPIITKDGVTVANSILLRDPVENMGATLLKEAARKTVQEAGDGTTTATVLAHALLTLCYATDDVINSRELKDGIDSGVEKVIKYLEKISTPVKNQMIDQVATISANNDKALGKIIGDSFRAVDETGVVMMEVTDQPETTSEIVDGIQYDKGFANASFITDQIKGTAELDNPLVLIIQSEIPNVRKIQGILEHVIKNNKSLLIVGDAETQVLNALAMNKLKGNIKVNIIPAPTYGVNRQEIIQDLALLTGATVINEDLGDDMDLIQPEMLGKCIKSVSTSADTIIQVDKSSEKVLSLIEELRQKITDEKHSGFRTQYEKRLAMLLAKVAVVKVGANSDVELKEKKDRVEDAICATKAAIKEGIVPGGGIALLNASGYIKPKSRGEEILLEAIKYPFNVILSNAGIGPYNPIIGKQKGKGLDVVTGNMVNMIKSGIIDPLLVTKSALKNAASVATTILSTDCVINNLRIDEGNRE